MNDSADPFALERFVEAHERDYARALAEIRAGHKRSHWMWYILPQYTGLGYSSTSQHFAIKSVEEGKAYLAHPILGPHLQEICKVLLGLENRTAHEIFGSPDDMKLRSCVTLFGHVCPADSVFQRVLEKFFGGEPDPQTLQLLKQGKRG